MEEGLHPDRGVPHDALVGGGGVVFWGWWRVCVRAELS